MIEITADFQSSQNYLMEFLLLDIADLFFQSSYRILCLTVKNHVVEKTGQGWGRIIFPQIHEKTIPAQPRVFLGSPGLF